MNILVINPPCRESTIPALPLGLLYIAQPLIEDGHTLTFLDIALEKYNRHDVLSTIESEKFDLMIVGGIITTYSYIKWLTNEAKKLKPDIPILGGGFVATPIPQIIFENTGIDVICNGEGDITVEEYVSVLEKNGDISKVAGLFIKEGSSFISTPDRPLIKDLDAISLPLDAYKLINIEKYIAGKGKSMQSTLESREMWHSTLGDCRLFDILSGRGCIGRCTFCYRMIKGMRKHSVAYVIAHMKYLMENYKVNLFQFNDELFIENGNWADEFCATIKENNMDVRFRITSRANMINDEILRKLKSAGCININVGFESGSQRMLDSMKKFTKVEQNYNAYKLLKKYNMIAGAPTVQGLPGETKESLMETLKFIEDCNVDDAVVYYATPYPNSDIYQYALKEGLIQDEDKYLEWISNSDASELKINLTQLQDVDLIYYHWLLAEAIRRNMLKIEFNKNERSNKHLYIFVLKHYGVNILYHTGLFKLAWNLKNAVEIKKKKICAV